MTNIAVGAGRQVRLVQIVRNWWPVPTVLAVSLVAQDRLLTSRYDVGGHATEHLSSASVPFMAAALLCLLFWATPAARHQADLLVTAALWLATTVLVMIGNLRVVDDLIAAGYSFAPTASVPDVVDHSLANASAWYAEGAALILIAAWRRRRHIGNRATLAATLTTLIVPPWIIPGAGIIVLTFVRLVAHGRDLRPVHPRMDGASTQFWVITTRPRRWRRPRRIGTREA
jgi:hypothetical protein